MAFDKSLPSTQTKIRNYSTVLTSNFGAIEEGQDTLQQWKINLIERNAIPSAPAVNPTRVDNVMQLYSKQNADSLTDLYVLDDRATANIIELTENGKLGGRAQQAVFQNVSFGTETSTYASTNMVAYWAIVDSGGNIVAQSGGLGASRTGTGRYNITFSTAQSSVNYGVVSTVEDATSGNAHISFYYTKTVNDFNIGIKNGNGTLTNKAFTVTVYGGRS